MNQSELHKIISTLGYIGFSKIASGTVASFATAIFSYGCLRYLGIYPLIFFFMISATLGSYSTFIYLKDTGGIDPKEVVIDEFAGQSLAIIISFLFAKSYGEKNLLILVALNFVLFRFFDITKIFPISYFDNIENAFGVMADDVVAGIIAALCFLLMQIYFFA